ncbi:hypothetical protein [Roseovarius sp. D22-M7]
MGDKMDHTTVNGGKMTVDGGKLLIRRPLVAENPHIRPRFRGLA